MDGMEKFLADECVHLPVVEALRKSGHDVLLVRDICLGCKDDEVLCLAIEQDRILLTRDKDFGELVIRLQKEVPGIIRYNLLGMPLDRQAEYIVSALKNVPEPLAGYITTVELGRLRQRRIC